MKRGILAARWGRSALVVLVLTAPVWSQAAVRPARAAEQPTAQQSSPSIVVAYAALGINARLLAGYGELVAGVRPGGMAEQMGLKAGDVIQAVNGREVIAEGAMSKSLAAATPGGVMTLKIRDARSGEVTYRTLGR